MDEAGGARADDINARQPATHKNLDEFNTCKIIPHAQTCTFRQGNPGLFIG